MKLSVDRWILTCGRYCLGLALVFLALACHKGPVAEQILILGAYTAPREAFREINERFQDHWQGKTGQTLRIKESYLSSGAQSRAVVDGFDADVVALSLDSDVDRLVQAKLIRHPWRQGPTGGYLTESVVAFAVRPGNPKNISDWSDLLQTKLKILTPNPKTSGGAQWNILAAYGSVLRGKVPGYAAGAEGAQAFLTKLLSQVVAMGKGARESILTFERGLGDVALSYENEIKQGQASGQKYQLIVPTATMLIQNPVALVDRNVERHGNRAVAQAYLDFLLGAEAQEIFAKHGFRPVLPEVKKKYAAEFPKVADLFTIGFFGGWDKVNSQFFGEKGIFVEASEAAHRQP